MSVRIRARITGLTEAAEKITGLDDRKQLADRIAGELESGTIRRFQEEKEPSGKPWKANLRGGKILNFQGFMKDSITTYAEDDYVEIGSNLPYAGVHQTGAVIKARFSRFLQFCVNGRWARKSSVEIQARPYLGISKDDEKRIQLCIGDFMTEALRG